MNKIYTLFLFACISFNAHAQNCPVQVTFTQPSCFGSCNGTATAFGTNPGPFSYQWSTNPVQTTQTATGLCAGSYSVLVVNGSGCTGVGQVTVTQPTQLQSAVSGQNNTSCTNCNGSAVSTAFGGTPPYTYSWLPGGQTTGTITGLCAGVYTFIVTDANGCTSQSLATIANSTPSIFVNPTGQSPTCTNCNGTLFAQASGGQSPYSYSWAPSGCTTQTCTGVCAGTYTCYVTDANGCTGSQTFTLTASSGNLSAVTTGSNPTSCTNCNGFVAASAQGGTSPYTYSWSNGCTTSQCSGLCAGTYTVTITDANGCTATNSWTLTAQGSPQFGVSATPAQGPNCDNGTATATPNNPGTYTYSWATSPVQTTQTATGLSQGVYTVCVTDVQNGCSACQLVTVSCITGVEDASPGITASVYPNPASGFVTVDYSGSRTGEVRVEFTNMLGEVMYAQQLSSKGHLVKHVDVSAWPKGIYLVRITSGESALTRKLIIH